MRIKLTKDFHIDFFRKEIFLLLITLVIIGVIYFWISSGGTWHFGQESYYGDLADAILKGKINLLIEPKEPYLLDLSIYKGKYYLYWGIVPALMFNIPARLISNSKMPDAFSVLIYTYGTLLFSVGILYYLRRIFFKEVNFWILNISVITIGLGNISPYLLGFASGWPLSIYVD